MSESNIAVVIPCYKVKTSIEKVISDIPSVVGRIYCIDDCCPDKSGDFIEENITDPRVKVLRNNVNLGVGGAVMHGYRAAHDDGYHIAVKIDGDGQMDPLLLPAFVRPILNGEADYTKGNRFYNLRYLESMPAKRLIGNAALSFISKISTGYWHLFDPTNGYTALHLSLLDLLPFDKISKRYFFESDLLFRLNIARACVKDVPMKAVYGDEESHLKINQILLPFLKGHLKNVAKRFFYSYILRDFQVASLNFILGFILFFFGIIFGSIEWLQSIETGEPATAGTVSLAVLPIFIGVQLVLSAINNDILNVPRAPLHPTLEDETLPPQ
ncbi:glycosyltransferase family 2 protein [Terasakiella pusilla]|uniref:glycosyltransferase family 2 protein n=1 Tax=Terasakiella pusilla TaxID=64973 RepID=UPI003AA96E4F